MRFPNLEKLGGRAAVFAVVFALTAGSAFAVSGNLLVNGGADAANDGPFPGWALIAGATETLSYSAGGGGPTGSRHPRRDVEVLIERV